MNCLGAGTLDPGNVLVVTFLTFDVFGEREGREPPIFEDPGWGIVAGLGKEAVRLLFDPGSAIAGIEGVVNPLLFGISYLLSYLIKKGGSQYQQHSVLRQRHV